jgi:hypothetical protein
VSQGSWLRCVLPSPPPAQQPLLLAVLQVAAHITHLSFLPCPQLPATPLQPLPAAAPPSLPLSLT